MQALAKADCLTNRAGTAAKIPSSSNCSTSNTAAARVCYDYAMDPEDLAEILKKRARGARECGLRHRLDSLARMQHRLRRCRPAARRGNFLKRLAHEAIDSGADLFVTTGNHNLGASSCIDRRCAACGPFLWIGEFLLERCAGSAAARFVPRKPRTAVGGLVRAAEGDRLRSDRAAESRFFRARFHLSQRHCGQPFRGQSAGGAHAVSGRGWLRRALAAERDTAPGQGCRRVGGDLPPSPDATAAFGLPPLDYAIKDNTAILRPSPAVPR
jgi:hypothetical protein